MECIWGNFSFSWVRTLAILLPWTKHSSPYHCPTHTRNLTEQKESSRRTRSKTLNFYCTKQFVDHKLLSELLNLIWFFFARLQQHFRNQNVKAYGRLTSREGSYYTRMINISYCIPGHEANLLLNRLDGDRLNTTWLEKKSCFQSWKKKVGGGQILCDLKKSIMTCNFLHLLPGRGKTGEYFKLCPSYLCVSADAEAVKSPNFFWEHVSASSWHDQI